MRPKNLKAKIFLDGSDLDETKKILTLLGFLDGQTTNPTNFAKSPEVVERIKRGEKFDRDEVYAAYKKRVQQLSALLPDGAISIEVYAEKATTAEQMFAQGKEMFSWIANAHIKFPTTTAGLAAAERAIAEGMRVNMTLVFTQSQAAAVYAATKGANRGSVFVSPFIGRWFDRGVNGMDLIKNILKMYEGGDGHVEVLTSSVRTAEQFEEALAIGTDIITAYFKAIESWGEAGMPTPPLDSFKANPNLAPIPYQSIDLNQPWTAFDVSHELTDKGLESFANDWNSLIK